MSLTRSKLFTAPWWKAALLRALYTAVAIAVPYVAGAALIGGVPVLTLVSAATVGAILSLFMSLAGLSEAVGVDLPWWLAAVERVTKSFFQSLGGALVGVTLLHEIDWSTALQLAASAAALSFLRLVLATLPNDPTPEVAIVESAPITIQHVAVPPAGTP